MADWSSARLTDPGLSRRQFLGASLTSAAVLYAGGGLTLMSPSATAASGAYETLREVDVLFFSALLPAVVVQARSEDVRPAFLDSFDHMLSQAAPSTIGAIRDLVNLLTNGLTRSIMTLTLSDWDEKSTAEVEEILEDWRGSSIGLKQIAYGLTTTLIRTAWYMQPDQQAITGYPGPPQKVVST